MGPKTSFYEVGTTRIDLIRGGLGGLWVISGHPVFQRARIQVFWSSRGPEMDLVDCLRRKSRENGRTRLQIGSILIILGRRWWPGKSR